MSVTCVAEQNGTGSSNTSVVFKNSTGIVNTGELSAFPPSTIYHLMCRRIGIITLREKMMQTMNVMKERL